MARLLRKIPNNLNDLPTDWTTRAEFVDKIQADNKLPDKTVLSFVRHSWQLTKPTCVVLMKIYTWYSIKFNDEQFMTGKIILNLDKIVNGPWFFHIDRLIIWNQGAYFEIRMFEDDVRKFVDFYVPPEQ